MEQSFERKKGVRGKTFIDVTSDQLVVDLSARDVNKLFGEALVGLIQNQWIKASDRFTVSNATIKRRLWAQTPEGRRSRWYRERYGGGTRSTPPKEANLRKWGRDSDRLLTGLKLNFQRSSSKDQDVGRINVPANRLEKYRFGPGYEQWALDLRTRVPLMSGQLDTAISDPATRHDLQQMINTIAETRILAGKGRIEALRAKRNRALLGLVKQLARIAVAA